MNRRIDRFEKFFEAKGQGQVADWMRQLRGHINAVGGEEALKSLLAEKGGGSTGEVQYGGIDTESNHWANHGDFIESYLNRNGIIPLTGQAVSGDVPVINSQTNEDPYYDRGQKPIDWQPVGPAYDDKLQEAKDLPGLESSEDIGVIMGEPVTHLTQDVMDKMDERYGKGQWIIKTYGDYAYAGQGIYFPQRIAQLKQDAQNAIWNSGAELSKYGFSHLRDKSGKIVGIQHDGGDQYLFGSKKYNSTIDGDVRRAGDMAASAAANEKGVELPTKEDGQPWEMMAQPAFKVVGVSDEARAQGKTWEGNREGRVHLVTRNGKVEVIPHSTWIKGDSMPVVFEDEDTKAMAQAAREAIEKLPPEARNGQIYAPDIVKTDKGHRLIELNASVEYGGSGYLSDNPLIIDSFVSHMTGREPQHVRFIRDLLSKKKRA